jgi:diphthine synthase
MLFLVGLGLDEGDISSKALEALRISDDLLLDRYTSILSEGYIDYIRHASGKQISIIKRSDLEESVESTVGRAKEKNVAILVPGDPLIATTHHIIIDAAEKLHIPYKIFHSASIFSAAIGESCLDIYRFGPTTTIPFWRKNYKPISFVDVILKNLSNNEHTLVLLDIDAEKGETMGISEALSLLGEAWKAKGPGIDFSKLKIMVLGNVGKKGQKIGYGSVSDMAEVSAEFKGMAISIIIPSSLNFAEEESVKKFVLKR